MDTALHIIAENDERLYEAELYRLKGELLLMEGKPEADVERCLQQAIQVARHQGAKTLELRSTVSLGRLYQRQNLPRSIGGKTAEAREALAQIYNWFTEGLDTVDLKEARVLLEELS